MFLLYYVFNCESDKVNNGRIIVPILDGWSVNFQPY